MALPCFISVRDFKTVQTHILRLHAGEVAEGNDVLHTKTAALIELDQQAEACWKWPGWVTMLLK